MAGARRAGDGEAASVAFGVPALYMPRMFAACDQPHRQLTHSTTALGSCAGRSPPLTMRKANSCGTTDTHGLGALQRHAGMCRQCSCSAAPAGNSSGSAPCRPAAPQRSAPRTSTVEPPMPSGCASRPSNSASQPFFFLHSAAGDTGALAVSRALNSCMAPAHRRPAATPQCCCEWVLSPGACRPISPPPPTGRPGCRPSSCPPTAPGHTPAGQGRAGGQPGRSS